MSRLSAAPAAPSRRALPDAMIGYLPVRPRATRSFAPAADDPLAALEVAIGGKIGTMRPSPLTSHGKPTGGTPVFGARRAPARRAGFRTPPR